jgi:hypothetical protein
MPTFSSTGSVMLLSREVVTALWLVVYTVVQVFETDVLTRTGMLPRQGS